MSRFTTQEFECPCGEKYSGQIYEYVNVVQDPQLRYVVLAGLLNVVSCPFCGRKIALAQPFIYSDSNHELFIYVHPREDVPDEARQLIIEKLGSVYGDLSSKQDPSELPGLQVIFGLDHLNLLINEELDPDERLGKLAMSTQSKNTAERGQFEMIAKKLASEMECCVDIEDLPDEYTVWLYGSRTQIGRLMQELAPRG
jgi:hypothetical protein